jgi:uncharacterized radical SAM superfamily Fe-S cluster-containing enzyme
VTPNSKIFCNTPWYELHIYWDGSLGICCQEDHKLYSSSDQQYNIANMSIQEWFNSDPVKKFRTDILGNQRVSACRRCYVEEDHGGNSRRLKSNQKSVIFTRTAFNDSYVQSPGYKNFFHSYQNHGETTSHPIDLHIDLGNFCNLACKMCGPRASSTIASQQVRWGITSSEQYLGTDWTKNLKTWENFKQQLLHLPGLTNIHFMGGETLLTDRMDDLVDFMIEHKKFDLCFSFVSNGTVYKPALIEKLKQFQRVGIEISIETIDEHNAYQRQGTNTDLVLTNIQRYLEQCNGTSVTVTLRPAISLLTIGYYSQLLHYALKHQLIVKGLLVTQPNFLSAEILPDSVKSQYQTQYVELLNHLKDIDTTSDYNASDPNNYQLVVKQQAEMCWSLLQTPAPGRSEQLWHDMVRHCEKWDQVYGYDARSLYPEFKQIFDQHGYRISS